MSPRLSLSTIQALQNAENGDPSKPRKQEKTEQLERRSYPRFNFGIPVRFVCTDGTDHQGELLNISRSSLALTSGALPSKGSFITLHIDEQCSYEGHVVRLFDTGFALKLRTERGRNGRPIEIRQQSKNAQNRSQLQVPTSLRKRTAKVRRPGGVIAKCQVTRFSFDRLSVNMEDPPQYGEMVQVGLTRGHISKSKGRNVEIELSASPETRSVN